MKKMILLVLLFAVSAVASVTDTTTKQQYFTCNGSTTTFTFTMSVNAASEVTVQKVLLSTGDPTTLTVDTDYTIAATGSDYLNGGVVTISPALAATFQLVITRDIALTQETSSGAMSAAAAVTALDKITRQVQDQRNDIAGKVLRIPDSDPSTAYAELTNYVSRKGRFLGFNSTTGAPEVIDLTTGVTVSVYAETYLDDISEAAFKATTNLTTGTDLQAWDAGLDDIAALAVTNSNFIVGDGTNWVAETGATARASMGLTIGTDVQAADAGLLSIAGLTTAANKMIYTTASDTYATTDLTAFARTLLDDADAATARTTLGIGGAGGFVDRGDPASADFDHGDLTTDNTWNDLDLSSIINNSDVVAVLLSVRVTDDAVDSDLDFRKNGNSNTPNKLSLRTQVANVTTIETGIVACDTNQVIEYKGSNLAFSGINITVMGWFN